MDFKDVSETEYQTALSVSPFIDPRCNGVDEIVKNIAKAIQSAMNSVAVSDNADKLKGVIKTMSLFDMGFKVTLDGLTYQKGLNENSFFKSVSSYTEKL